MPAADARAVETLDTLPAMGTAFARALVPARKGEARVPSHAVRVDGVRQDLDRLAAYTRVCGYTLRDAVPATWIHVLTFPLHVSLLGDRRSSVRLVGAVHASNAMTLHRPVASDERLALEVHAEALRPHARGAMLDLVGTARVDGETVWEGVSTYLVAGLRAPGEPVPVPREPFEPHAPQAVWRLAPDLGRRYRAVSHDPNPIHTNRAAAKAFGFARPIIHGMWTHARALAALEGRFGDAYSTHVSFVKPVLLPATIGFRATAVDAGLDAAVTTRDGVKPHLLMSVRSAS
ncbi:MaoC/PaaZ C-terminal domain-containing protein [Demequina gelatinilytica]|uniref:MaoC/PaaZ C-terminal domain-containing protein n=1 Tax=Demequina gelatinilytica TaxID=1638980 RepID=UPI000AD74475|nr:MaoC/PaaZ C-terminal domain-containing protein [Demequina gelatinilytica]